MWVLPQLTAQCFIATRLLGYHAVFWWPVAVVEVPLNLQKMVEQAVDLSEPREPVTDVLAIAVALVAVKPLVAHWALEALVRITLAAAAAVIGVVTDLDRLVNQAPMALADIQVVAEDLVGPLATWFLYATPRVIALETVN
jgi:hypothetical protein